MEFYAKFSKRFLIFAIKFNFDDKNYKFLKYLQD
jgi:hypothetical protein